MKRLLSLRNFIIFLFVLLGVSAVYIFTSGYYVNNIPLTIKSNEITISNVGFKSYILKMKNPNDENAKTIIKDALIQEFQSCNCVPSGYPQILPNGIRLSEKECDFIGIPGILSPAAFGVTIYLLPNNIFSKVKNDTPSIIIGDITPGHFCTDSPFFGLNTSRREVIERAFFKANIKGYEKYD